MLKDTVWGLVCAAVVLFAFGLLVAARRLRTLAIFGLVLAISSVALIITGSVMMPHYLGRIPDPVYRRGVSTEQHGPDAAGQRHGDPQPAARGQQRPRRAQR